MKILATLVLAMVLCSASAADLANMGIVDLSHPYNDNTLYWPTSPSTFALKRLSFGVNDRGWFYSANALCTPEHGGTHLDAPIHFWAHGQSVEQMPLDQLIGPAVVIDVSSQALENRQYRLTEADVLEFEEANGRIPTGAIVLLRTGWSHYWPDAKQYLGDDTRGVASRLSFPSFGEAAARLLVAERKIAVLGVDTASIDYGASVDFEVHQVAAQHNVAGLENLTNLDQLPATGSQVIALPMKIEGGSGAPVRVIALIPESDRSNE